MAGLSFLPGMLQPHPWLLAAGAALDLAIGDPVYRAHPVRLIGWTLTRFENGLRRIGLDGYFGGIALFLLLVAVWVGGAVVVFGRLGGMLGNIAGMALHVFVVYSLLALHDLLLHGWNVERAAQQGDVAGARVAIAKLVGRDTSKMDSAACSRAAIESLSENLTDGFISPIFWYAVGGIPGLLLFKVVSTMDSMVGYKTPRYLQFGWCGARTDDLMNLLPARLTYLLIAGLAACVPGCSAWGALQVGWRQHDIVPGPNSGWSEAATAGAIGRRLIGPIWAGGTLVTEIWLGDATEPPAGQPGDFRRAAILLTATGLSSLALAITALVCL